MIYMEYLVAVESLKIMYPQVIYLLKDAGYDYEEVLNYEVAMEMVCDFVLTKLKAGEDFENDKNGD